MAGTVTVTRKPLTSRNNRFVEKIQVDWTADAADGSLPNTSLTGLYGWLVKVVTNPGSTAPTANYDIKLFDPDDAAFDAAAGLLIDRHTTATEQVYPLIANGAVPLFFAGDYVLNITGNSVNSATGQIFFYFIENL